MFVNTHRLNYTKVQVRVPNAWAQVAAWTEKERRERLKARRARDTAPRWQRHDDDDDGSDDDDYDYGDDCW